MKKNIPNLFIVGAAKSATTSVHDILKSHVEIIMSPIKEPNYFADYKLKDLSKYKQQFYKKINNEISKNKSITEQHASLIEDEELYMRLFESSNHYKYYGESSVSYLFSINSAKKIHDFNPSSKIVIILRNPIARMISHFQMDKLIGELKEDKNSLEEIVIDEFNRISDIQKNSLNTYLGPSMYFEQIKRFYKFFPKENILVLNYEEDIKDNEILLEKLSIFLKIDKREFEVQKSSKNSKKIPRNKIISKFIKNSRYKRFFKKLFPENLKEILKSKVLYSSQIKEQSFTFPDEIIDLFIKEMNSLNEIPEINSISWNFDKYRKIK